MNIGFPLSSPQSVLRRQAEQSHSPAQPTAGRKLTPLQADTVKFSGFITEQMMRKDSNKQLSEIEWLKYRVNRAEKEMKRLDAEGLKEKTEELRDRLRRELRTPDLSRLNLNEPEMRQELDAALTRILPEAFAVAREATRRVTGKFQYDVQVLAGIALNQGKVAEMKTGEGKTLASVLPAYLNALVGRGVHIVTANEYLAERDAKDNAPIFQALGMSVGVANPPADLADKPEETRKHKQKAYQADVTYGTHSEFGFDYLRDHLRITSESEKVQRGFYFALVDEADSVLIDDAKTPLILSGARDSQQDRKLFGPNGLYNLLARTVRQMSGISKEDLKERQEQLLKSNKSLSREDAKEQILEAFDYTFDESTQEVVLTDAGLEHLEEMERFGLFPLNDTNLPVFHALLQSIRAKELYHKDKQYIVRNKQILIVDKSTGRLMHGRTWSDGLHYAIQAKEFPDVSQCLPQYENETLASITYQSLFRLYPKLAGMTGTALDAASEFAKIYGLKWIEIPRRAEYKAISSTNKVEHYPDVVARTQQEKLELVAKEIISIRLYGGPITVTRDQSGNPQVEANRPSAQGLELELLRKRPILVGTGSIAEAETLAELLKKQGIPVKLLTAKNAAEENEIIAQAGEVGMVTIATNMAGRGTDIDIPLGGLAEIAMQARNYTRENIPEERYQVMLKYQTDVLEAGKDERAKDYGLYVIGTERFHSRRVDGQLAGRTGRQGNPGYVRFFSSLEDPLYQANALERGITALHKKAPTQGASIERTLGKVQEQVETRDAKERMEMLKYDVVLDQFRKAHYRQRDLLMKSQSWPSLEQQLEQQVETMLKRVVPILLPVSDALEALFDNADVLTEDELREKFAQHLSTVSVRPPGMAIHKDLPNDLLFDLCREIDLPKRINQHKGGSLLPDFRNQRLLRDLKNDYMSQINSIWQDVGILNAPQDTQASLRAQLLHGMDASWRQFLQEGNDLRDSLRWQIPMDKRNLAEHYFRLECDQIFQNMQIGLALNLFQAISAVPAELAARIRRTTQAPTRQDRPDTNP